MASRIIDCRGAAFRSVFASDGVLCDLSFLGRVFPSSVCIVRSLIYCGILALIIVDY